MSAFLPEPETASQPTPTPAPKSSKKTLLLWVALIVMFVTIWQFLSPPSRTTPSTHAAAPSTCVPETSSYWSSTLIALIPFVLFFVVCFLFLRAYRQNVRFETALEPGRIALAHRRFSEAVDLFRSVLPEFAKQPGYRAGVVLSVAEAQLKAGHLDDVLVSCAEIEQSRTLLFGSAYRGRVASMTAFVFALKGDLPLAERWAADGRSRLAKNPGYRLGLAGDLRLAEATIACRKGDHAAAVKLLEESWLELRSALTADAMRTVEIVRAFAEAQSGVRAMNTVAERFVRIEPVVQGEFTFLGTQWPEMKAFLAAHGL